METHCPRLQVTATADRHVSAWRGGSILAEMDGFKNLAVNSWDVQPLVVLSIVHGSITKLLLLV